MHANISDKDTHEPVGNAPRNTVKFKAILSQQNIHYGLELRYTGSMYPSWSVILPDKSVIRPGQKVDSYWVADANIRYQPLNSNYALNFKVENLANTEIRYPASSNAPFTYGLIGAGRTLVFTTHFYLD